TPVRRTVAGGLRLAHDTQLPDWFHAVNPLSRHLCNKAVPLHKNPIVREAFVPALSGLENVFLIEPLSYPEYVDLLNNSSLIISDSSGAEEEGPTLGIRTLVLRTVTERPEAVSTGVAKLTGRDLKSILNNATDALVEIHNQGDRVHLGQPYGDGNASARCVAAIAKYFGKLPADHIAYQWSII
ncbi:hypothetical protein HKD26_14005, partial [Gluconobacter sp. R75629]|uniref:UDP-N-acetylglucosamine 2-epimerase n=1 Tax=unclassified Gluconobacter TaxID=2644261 RepID=UPI001884FD48